MTSSASRLSLLLLLAAPAAAQLPSFEPVPDVVPMPVGFGETDYAAYRDLGIRMEAAGQDFPAIFRAACARAVSRGGGAQEIRVMLAGLVTWLGDRSRERPAGIALQGRLDWAFHFTYGAWLEAIGPGLGERAAYRKEERDAFEEGNGYDLGDLAITLAGARWLRQEPGRLAEWGSGRRRLEDLPPCLLPKLPHGRLADEGQRRAAEAYAAGAF